MVDIHSHILPNIDDGAKDISITYQILDIMKTQGITDLVASPHFYPDIMDKEDFVQKRQEAYNLIDYPEIHILKGAEVLFHPCLMGYENVDDLCIEGTKNILIELNYSRLWGMETVSAIERFADKFQLTPIIVHVERYAALKKNHQLLESLMAIGCLIQVNSEGFERFWERKRLIKLIKEKKVDLIASDTHNLTSRKPNLKLAYDYVKKSLGEETLEELISNAQMVING